MYFKSQLNEDPPFFYEFQMDADGQTTNIFWANTQMINDYQCYGDVITLNTTYKTNDNYTPLGVFFGYNNHRQTMVFGATLLFDETFHKAIGGKRPTTILTDQDAAMASVITFHGLCTWHIRENALRHMNHLYKTGSELLEMLKLALIIMKHKKSLSRLGMICL